MRKRIALGSALLFVLLAAAVYLGPYWTVRRMQSAIAARDYTAFSSYVDFPALRDSFRRQMMDALGDSSDDTSLGAFGKGLVASLTTPVLDVVVTPAGVIEMMNTGVPKITQAVVAGAITRVPTVPGTAPKLAVSYRSWDSAAFRRADAPPDAGNFILRREGLLRWKLAAVELPE